MSSRLDAWLDIQGSIYEGDPMTFDLNPAAPNSSFDSNCDLTFDDIQTLRLDLIAITPESLHIQQRDSAEMKTELGTCIGATVPDQWPPEHWEPHVFEFLLKQFAATPELIGWTRYLVLRHPENEGGSRTLIGTCGSWLPNPETGEAEIGYGVLHGWQRQGYAAEAVRAMLPWLQTRRTIHAFVAQTFPDLYGSIRVLEKCGFEPAGKGYEEGAILFRKLVTSLQAGARPPLHSRP
jgi:ribosomal-protein-alanine N-acetyltransferase